jgi:hypothetical protein
MSDEPSHTAVSGPVRWSGLALILTGPLIVVGAVLHPNILQTDVADAILHTPTWALIHLLAVAAMLLTLVGVIGLYARQADRMGALGLAGLLVAVPGILAVACAGYAEALFPVVASHDPKLLALDGPVFHSGILWATEGIAAGYPIGLFLLALATLRARVLPRGAAIAVLVGAPTFAVFAGLFVPVLNVASTTLFAVGCAWLGYAIWSSPRAATAAGRRQRTPPINHPDHPRASPSQYRATRRPTR